MRAWWRLFVASLRMVYRSRDTVLVGLAQPVILIVLLALYKQLRFETGAGTIDFFSFVATGWAAYGVVGVASTVWQAAAADYRVLGVLKRVAVTPISPAAFVSTQVVARVGAAVVQIAATLGIAAVLGVPHARPADAHERRRKVITGAARESGTCSQSATDGWKPVNRDPVNCQVRLREGPPPEERCPWEAPRLPPAGR